MCRLQYLCVTAFTLPAIAVERLLAVRYVYDYEKRSRAYISTTAIVIVDAVSLAFVVGTAFDQSVIVFVLFTASAGVANVLSVTVLYLCYRRNMRYYAANLKSVVEKKKWHHSKVYSLSQRYQVEENIIVARLIRRICVITFVFITVCALVYVPLLVLRSGVIEWFATAAIDIGVAMFANVLALVILTGIPAFRRHVKMLFRRNNVIEVTERRTPHVKNALGVPLIYNHQQEANMYFDQFKNAWG